MTDGWSPAPRAPAPPAGRWAGCSRPSSRATETGGLIGASLVTQPAGIAPPLHVHTREAEAWYLLDGTLTYQAGEERVELEPGGFIFLPQGLPHAFRTTSAVRYLALTLPGGVMDCTTRWARPRPQRRLPDGGITGEEIARWMAAAPRYGLQVVGPPIG